jgi:hypothetical protein
MGLRDFFRELWPSSSHSTTTPQTNEDELIYLLDRLGETGPMTPEQTSLKILATFLKQPSEHMSSDFDTITGWWLSSTEFDSGLTQIEAYSDTLMPQGASRRTSTSEVEAEGEGSEAEGGPPRGVAPTGSPSGSRSESVGATPRGGPGRPVATSAAVEVRREAPQGNLWVSWTSNWLAKQAKSGSYLSELSSFELGKELPTATSSLRRAVGAARKAEQWRGSSGRLADLDAVAHDPSLCGAGITAFHELLSLHNKTGENRFDGLINDLRKIRMKLYPVAELHRLFEEIETAWLDEPDKQAFQNHTSQRIAAVCRRLKITRESAK